jgi:hypothetical protein
MAETLSAQFGCAVYEIPYFPEVSHGSTHWRNLSLSAIHGLEASNRPGRGRLEPLALYSTSTIPTRRGVGALGPQKNKPPTLGLGG